MYNDLTVNKKEEEINPMKSMAALLDMEVEGQPISNAIMHILDLYNADKIKGICVYDDSITITTV